MAPGVPGISHPVLREMGTWWSCGAPAAPDSHHGTGSRSNRELGTGRGDSACRCWGDWEQLGLGVSRGAPPGSVLPARAPAGFLRPGLGQSRTDPSSLALALADIGRARTAQAVPW